MRQVVSVTPLYDRILCQRVAAPDTTKGGLFIPDAGRERPQEAVVIAVGCGKATDVQHHNDMTYSGSWVCRPVLVRPGDTILIGKYAGAEVSVGSEQYLILREDEILGIVNVTEVPDPEPAEVGQENA